MQSREEIKNKLTAFIAENYIDITSKKYDFPKFLTLEEPEELKPCLPCEQVERIEPAAKKRGIKAPAFFRQTSDKAKEMQTAASRASMPQAEHVADIDDFLQESFEEDGVAKRLNLYMYERDITTAMIYKRCFVDRRLISKITGGTNYHPSKNTMLALCIGLQLNLQEGEEFLLLAGYSFSNSSKYDLIIKFMLQNEIYDLDTINEMLYQYEQPCLGA